jgi:hypothetical protein
MNTHHQKNETITLRLCNQPSTLLSNSSNGFFTAKIPGHLRGRAGYAHVVAGTVELDGIFPASTDTHSVIVRHNIPTNSYDTTTKGTNQIFGTVIRASNAEKIGHLSEAQSLDLGSVILPAEIEIETLCYNASNKKLVRCSQAAHLIDITLMIEFPHGQ